MKIVNALDAATTLTTTAPVVTVPETPIEAPAATDTATGGVLQKAAAFAEQNPATVAGGVVAVVGLGYLAYRWRRNRAQRIAETLMRAYPLPGDLKR